MRVRSNAFGQASLQPLPDQSLQSRAGAWGELLLRFGEHDNFNGPRVQPIPRPSVTCRAVGSSVQELCRRSGGDTAAPRTPAHRLDAAGKFGFVQACNNMSHRDIFRRAAYLTALFGASLLRRELFPHVLSGGSCTPSSPLTESGPISALEIDIIMSSRGTEPMLCHRQNSKSIGRFH